MYRLFAIALTLLLSMGFTHGSRLSGQDVRVTIESAGMWPVDGYSKVVVSISGASGAGPARFFMPLPEEFSVMAHDEGAGDFYYVNQQVNIVWNRMPSGGEVTVSFYVMPAGAHTGRFSITGLFHYVTAGSVRESSASEPFSVTIGGTGAVTTAQATAAREGVLASRRLPQPALPVSRGRRVGERPRPSAVVTAGDRSDAGTAVAAEPIVFRVQVASSSSRLSGDEVKSRLGLDIADSITVTREGDLFRYQAGELGDYESAERLMALIRKQGVEGAFIVAFRGERQIPIAEARGDKR
jgi:hypothetical protein